MPDTVLISLDEALAWACGKPRLQVRLLDGTSLEMGVMQYRSLCDMQERLRAHRGKPEPAHGELLSEQMTLH